MIKCAEKSTHKVILPIALLFGLIAVIYSNTLNSSWHFDDYDNIIYNSKLHMTDLTINSIVGSFYAQPNKNDNIEILYRPIACLTFALNWYFGKNNVLGYHLVNITIHIFTSFFLYLFIVELFHTPGLKRKNHDDPYFVALLAAVIWAINPIHVQAVTYIVQRMTSLAALFYLIGLYVYLLGRHSKKINNACFFYSLLFISFLFAIGCKQNAIIFPASIVLMEIFFFEKLTAVKRKQRVLLFALSIGIPILIGIFVFLKGDFLGVLDGYSMRSFSFLERCLTEPRIVIGYITKIFYPVASRLSIVYDIHISKSLFNPMTTLFSFAFIFMVITLSILFASKIPLLSFSVLFFFLNHIIESTIIPLELIFDHRNYLPSFFLFVPVTVYLKKIISFYKNQNHYLYYFLIVFVTLLIISLGLGTYTWNMAWKSEKSLWEDAAQKAPGSARPVQNIAGLYYSKIGSFDKAIQLYTKALDLYDSKPQYTKFISYYSIANLYYEKHEYKKAYEYIVKAIDIYPENHNSRFKKVQFLLYQGRLVDAQKEIDSLLSQDGSIAKFLLMKGRLLLLQTKKEEAIGYFRKSLKKNPYDPDTNLYLGVSLILQAQYEKAEMYLQASNNISPGNIYILFALIENSHLSNRIAKKDFYIDKLFAQHTIKEIKSSLMELNKNYFLPPISQELLNQIISHGLTSVW